MSHFAAFAGNTSSKGVKNGHALDTPMADTPLLSSTSEQNDIQWEHEIKNIMVSALLKATSVSVPDQEELNSEKLEYLPITSRGILKEFDGILWSKLQERYQTSGDSGERPSVTLTAIRISIDTLATPLNYDALTRRLQKLRDESTAHRPELSRQYGVHMLTLLSILTQDLQEATQYLSQRRNDCPNPRLGLRVTLYGRMNSCRSSIRERMNKLNQLEEEVNLLQIHRKHIHGVETTAGVHTKRIKAEILGTYQDLANLGFTLDLNAGPFSPAKLCFPALAQALAPTE